MHTFLLLHKHIHTYTYIHTYIHNPYHWEGVLHSTINVSGPLRFDGSKNRNIGNAQTLLPKLDAYNCMITYIHTYIHTGNFLEGPHKERERAKVLSSHFRISAVSDRFQHHTYTERCRTSLTYIHACMHTCIETKTC